MVQLSRREFFGFGLGGIALALCPRAKAEEETARRSREELWKISTNTPSQNQNVLRDNETLRDLITDSLLNLPDRLILIIRNISRLKSSPDAYGGRDSLCIENADLVAKIIGNLSNQALGAFIGRASVDFNIYDDTDRKEGLKSLMAHHIQTLGLLTYKNIFVADLRTVFLSWMKLKPNSDPKLVASIKAKLEAALKEVANKEGFIYLLSILGLSTLANHVGLSPRISKQVAACGRQVLEARVALASASNNEKESIRGNTVANAIAWLPYYSFWEIIEKLPVDKLAKNLGINDRNKLGDLVTTVMVFGLFKFCLLENITTQYQRNRSSGEPLPPYLQAIENFLQPRGERTNSQPMDPNMTSSS